MVSGTIRAASGREMRSGMPARAKTNLPHHATLSEERLIGTNPKHAKTQAEAEAKFKRKQGQATEASQAMRTPPAQRERRRRACANCSSQRKPRTLTRRRRTRPCERDQRRVA